MYLTTLQSKQILTLSAMCSKTRCTVNEKNNYKSANTDDEGNHNDDDGVGDDGNDRDDRIGHWF